MFIAAKQLTFVTGSPRPFFYALVTRFLLLLNRNLTDEICAGLNKITDLEASREVEPWKLSVDY